MDLVPCEFSNVIDVTNLQFGFADIIEQSFVRVKAYISGAIWSSYRAFLPDKFPSYSYWEIFDIMVNRAQYNYASDSFRWSLCHTALVLGRKHPKLLNSLDVYASRMTTLTHASHSLQVYKWLFVSNSRGRNPGNGNLASSEAMLGMSRSLLIDMPEVGLRQVCPTALHYAIDGFERRYNAL